MDKKILIVGSLNMDLMIELDSMPKVGETVLAKASRYVPGGKGANQTFAAGKLGGNVTMLGCVGEDQIGEELLSSIAGSGADISHIKRASGISTGLAVIYVNREGSNSIVVLSGANTACTVDYLKTKDDLFRNADYVMLQMEIPHESVFYAIRRAHELGKQVILNPAPAPDPGSFPEDIWEKIDYITPNETELIKLAGLTEQSAGYVEKGADCLLEKGVKNVLVTLGENGVYYCNSSQSGMFPARRVDAVDTTAAGDCFSGAFVTAIAEGKSVSEAISLANAASSVAVTRKGAQSSIPTREEVENLKGWEKDI